MQKRCRRTERIVSMIAYRYLRNCRDKSIVSEYWTRYEETNGKFLQNSRVEIKYRNRIILRIIVKDGANYEKS